MSGFVWSEKEVRYLKENWPCKLETRSKQSCQIKAIRLGLTKKYDTTKDKSETKFCMCGCGTQIKRWQINCVERFYAYGHQPRSKPTSFIEYRRAAWSGSNNPVKKFSQVRPGKRAYPRSYEKVRTELLASTPQCVVCVKNRPTNIHHKDGDTYNNVIINLMPVCRSCHTKIHMI